MDDPNSPERVEARKDQVDPLIMYLVVRESLGMGMGKTAAQCAHAAQMLIISYSEGHASDTDLETFDTWLKTSFRKVVLKADEKEWAKLRTELPNAAVVRDAGLTEVAPGSETVIGVWPMPKSKRSKTIQRLQVLK